MSIKDGKDYLYLIWKSEESQETVYCRTVNKKWAV